MEEPILLEEYRGSVLENVHRGSIAVVDLEGKVVASLGDVEKVCYYRSTAKPFQTIPTIMRGLPERYHLTQDQVSILNASHWGRNHHLNTLTGILERTGFQEEDFIMFPFMPLWHKFHGQLTAESLPEATDIPGKLTHDCSGKHLNLMMLQKELTGSQKDYWKLESPAQQEVLGMIARFSGMAKDKIAIGVDGCGVPVFGVPLRNIAWSYARLIHPECLGDRAVVRAVQYDLQCIHAYPEKINDFDTPVYILNSNDNYIAKDGARGIWCVGLKKEGLGIAVKLEDGYDTMLHALLIANILEQLGCGDKGMIDALRASVHTEVINDNRIPVGHYRSSFCLHFSL